MAFNVARVSCEPFLQLKRILPFGGICKTNNGMRSSEQHGKSSSAAVCTLHQVVPGRVPPFRAHLCDPNEGVQWSHDVRSMSCQALCACGTNAQNRITSVTLLQYARDEDMRRHGCQAVGARVSSHPRECTTIWLSPTAQERARQLSQRCRRHKCRRTRLGLVLACTRKCYFRPQAVARTPGTRTRTTNTAPGQSKRMPQPRTSQGRHHCF